MAHVFLYDWHWDRLAVEASPRCDWRVCCRSGNLSIPTSTYIALSIYLSISLSFFHSIFLPLTSIISLSLSLPLSLSALAKTGEKI
ncbi:unnamed protein product [Protopolystoma xenopodis]|uniref:Uncharacterized protein n=1 Tax=Protopolystoma xenopodis TaxID=117903 RepID=A0A3S5A791_9PLAT|nr:unnamed protein product [Protopolystoma xenopodis]